jgi:small subunit ribosomal protein S7
MLHGKKSIAYNIFYDAIAIVEELVKNGLETWKKALSNVTPQLKLEVEELVELLSNSN